MVKVSPEREIRKLGYRLGKRKIKGGNGTIVDAYDQDDRYCAVKFPGRGTIKHDRFQKEAEAYRVLSSIDGIPDLYDVWGNEASIPLITLQFVPGETLARARSYGLDEKEQLKYCFEVARILNDVHGLDWVHNDVNATNVIIGEDGSVTLVDLTCAGHIDSFTGAIFHNADISPPEVEDGIVTKKSDVYMLGKMTTCSVIGLDEELVSAKALPHHLREAHEEGMLKSYFGHMAEPLYRLLNEMVRAEYNSRPTMMEIVNEGKDLFAGGLRGLL